MTPLQPVFLALFALILICTESAAGFWFLSDIPLGMLSGSSPLPCENIPGLLKSQRLVCMEQPEVMVTIGEGVRTGIEECQHQFKDQRWNCTTIQKEDQAGTGKLALKVGSREGAFVHAISSAGVVHSITRGCSSGDLSNCACDKRVTPAGMLQRDEKGNFTWTGCSDNVRYAVRFARKFVDVVEKHKREDVSGTHHHNDGGRALINLHNNRVGRKIVQESLVKQCKCHGVSGSCAVRTCWLAIPSFHRTGDLLRKKFDQAKMVRMTPDGDAVRLATEPNHTPLRTDLVYYESSPDYCSTNYITGSLGTGGRVCRLNSTGADSCEIMCCGRGYDTRRVERTRQCRCKFQWCCHVQCEQCTEWIDEQVCKPDSGIVSRPSGHERLRSRSAKKLPEIRSLSAVKNRTALTSQLPLFVSSSTTFRPERKKTAVRLRNSKSGVFKQRKNLINLKNLTSNYNNVRNVSKIASTII